MLKKQIIRGGLVAATMSMVVACAPTDAPTTPSSPKPTTAPSATVEPTAEPSATAEPTAKPSATAEPTAEPTAKPSTEPSTEPTAAPSATPTPLPTATSDISVIERTTFNGSIYDDTNAPLDGVTVTARSLNSSVPFEETTTTAGGSYAFNNAPAGVQIEITASRPGYATRRRVEVLKSNKQGDPDANRYNFGTDGNERGNDDFGGTEFNGLSDLPEVISMSPGRNASGINPKTSFVLTFSEPMDRETVEDNFVIRSFTEESLTVDNQITFKAKGGTLTEPTPETGDKVWDEDAFDVSWNSDNTEVTFTFSDERMLPTDEDSADTPEYYVTFTNDDKQLKDASGITRDGGYFKLTEGNFEGAVKFAINTDTEDPQVSSIRAETDENSGTDGDMIRVRFSERMIHYTETKTIAGGMDGIATKAAAAVNNVLATQAADNYTVTITRGGGKILGPIKWATLGGSAVYDTTDVTHKTVKLLPGVNAGNLTVDGSTTVASNDTVLGTIYFRDGSTAPIDTEVSVTTGGPKAADIQNALNDLLIDSPANAFTISYVTGGDPLGAGDVHNITLAAGAKAEDKKDKDKNGDPKVKDIAMVVLTGGTAIDKLTAANELPIRLFPGTGAGASANLYKPGDNVLIKAGTSILDPAGNSLSSSNDDASANAS
ncbi:MAG: carboxypeptidase regulatory-like domain-containing protein [Candidatus Sericytochromatia bacterium]|nr:carboxypeptidase regulatory-like domain-containing protein [Candidatus Sericytochromatia bacterium]